MAKLTFRATAVNEDGLTFMFTFKNENWAGIDAAAREALDAVVAADPLHTKLAPWNYRNVDRHA